MLQVGQERSVLIPEKSFLKISENPDEDFSHLDHFFPKQRERAAVGVKK